MAKTTIGTFTLKEFLQITQQYVPNRYEYRKRDVVKRILIRKVINVERHDLPEAPRENVKYEIISKSWPQYSPYYTKYDKQGRPRLYQRTTSHHYDLTLEIDRLSINTVHWRGRVGSGKKWRKKPPQKDIKSLYPENKRRWTPNRIEAHRRKAKYLDVGDWNSQVQGINGDFIFRCSFAWWYHNHLFGRNYYGNIPARKTNPKNIVFAPKHFINLIDYLMQRGILKDD